MRSRNIKPGFFKNELLAELPPLARILFAGLWCMADRDGRLEDRPKRIKADCLPYDDCDVNGYLTELERLKFVARYEVGPLKLIQIKNFNKHQSPHNTEKSSNYPAPPDTTPTEDASCDLTVRPPLINGSGTVKNALIPDSLIPDCLIPGHTQPATKNPETDPFIDPLKANEEAKRLVERYQECVKSPHGIGGGERAIFARLTVDRVPASVLDAAIVAYAADCRAQTRQPKFRYSVAKFFGDGGWEEFKSGKPPARSDGDETVQQMVKRQRAAMIAKGLDTPEDVKL